MSDLDKTVSERLDDKIRKSRLAYSTPKLQVYGTVSDFTKGSQTIGSDGGGGSTRRQLSMREMKENITRVGTHPLGFGLYLFEYKQAFRDLGGHGRHFGVMVDEVEAILPDAVTAGPHGFKMIDYAALGITRN
ncbi:MAG TPA: tail fiber domain-containing protein [Hyphomicrobium sp.]|nr:tail fiber domain-containing protein [Hyphomicrobium sp.]